MRDFEYRQRRQARGVWFRLRRLLALASEVPEVAPRRFPRPALWPSA